MTQGKALIEVRINIARREVEYWQNILRDKSCMDCEHNDTSTTGCKLAGGLKPPPEIFKVGCDSWSWDCIPL